MQIATAARDRARRDRSILSSPKAEERVLRVALVDRGRIVDERIFDRAAVTIGATEKNDFVVDVASCTVLEPRGSTYVLRVPTRATALVADGSDHRVVRGGENAVLTSESRGRVTISERTVLFQMMPRPPKPRAVPLSASLRSGLEVDWTTTVIAAFSFLIHFGLVGALYSDWLDPVSDDSITVGAVIEAVRELPPAPPAEEPKTTNDASTNPSPQKPTASPVQKVSEGQRAGGTTRSGASQSRKASGDARAAELARELEGLDMAMLATLNSQGASTKRVLDDPTMPLGPVDGVATKPRGIGLQFGASDLPGRPGTSLLDLARDHNGPPGPDCHDCSLRPGPDDPVPGPTPPPSRPPERVVEPTGEIPDAGAVIGGLTGGFRRCYERGLRDENPSMQGSVRLLTTVGPNGEVASVSPSVGGSLSGSVVGCIVAKMRNAQFKPPTSGRSATLMVPVTLNPQ